MSRYPEEKPIGEVIKKLLKVYRMRGKLLEYDVQKAWEQVLGNSIASQTEKVSFREGVLYVKVYSPALKEELRFSVDKLMLHMNQTLGETLIRKVVLL